MNRSLITLCFLASFGFMSCDLLEDTDVDPKFFLECEIDGKMYRAQTNDEAFMSTSQHNPDKYVVTGHDIPKDFHVDLDLFRQLGEDKISVGVNINNILTSISLFMDSKTYSANAPGGSGCINVVFLSETQCEGTFSGVLVEILEETETRVITNGSFKVKTK